MPARARFGLCVAAVLGTSLSAQIATDIVEKRRADFHTQATDADMKREGGTQPRDWNYDLPGGITTRQITFYVDGGTHDNLRLVFAQAGPPEIRKGIRVLGAILSRKVREKRTAATAIAPAALPNI